MKVSVTFSKDLSVTGEGLRQNIREEMKEGNPSLMVDLSNGDIAIVVEDPNDVPEVWAKVQGIIVKTIQKEFGAD